MNVVCVKDYITSVCKYTAGKTYKVVCDTDYSIQIIDDADDWVALNKDTIGMGFNYHFKYLSEIRDNKLETLGI